MPTNNSIVRKRASALNKKRKSNEDENNYQSWDDSYEALVAYKLKNNNCEVPIDAENRLGAWVDSQRKKKSKLTSEKIEKLNSIGFAWESENDTWQKQFNKLREHREKYGDCNLEKSPLNGSGLEAWISKQRDAFKSGKLGTGRKELLDKLGMVWDTNTKPECPSAWSRFDDDDKLLKWIATKRKKKTNHRSKALIQTPYHEPKPKSDDLSKKNEHDSPNNEKDSGYGEAESRSDCILRNSQDSKKDSGRREPESRSDKLLKAPRASSKDNKDSGFQEPKPRGDNALNESKHKRKKVTTLPPKDSLVADPKPKHNVSKSRRVSWHGAEDDSWMEMYDKLRAFYESRGHSTITSTYENQSLVQWVSKQRQKASGNSYMSKKRRKLLNDINFRWLIGSDLYESDLSSNARNHRPQKNFVETVIGAIIAVYWPDDDVYYKGKVAQQSDPDGNFLVEYVDGYVDFINPNESTYVLLQHEDDPTPPRMVSADTKQVKIGSHISIWWPNESQYFDSVVKDIKMKEEITFKLKYDDGEIEWTSLENRKFLIDF
mmetsp:Transcript_23347/g.35356  ORF Transcript_23347/g.35356 Transcript_23347/m.35356 type:complete len:546 (+) Transcript_23347:106-1743(+)|eukprot:CAMPEP_0194218252 /NCGR_PEP_ID=MMETSP0156-20130528/23318_1 /TAXON_ID=33649 /ORGANISM="Thalassionema nitzschioides, Strain L26-B" /LENGTH=545 /DNA_ID=CAMNT_0038947537 /DNA_START=54 /DNA_END=1691 /DNA_ORIENTATION=+